MCVVVLCDVDGVLCKMCVVMGVNIGIGFVMVCVLWVLNEYLKIMFVC